MYLYVELWKAKDAWINLSPQRRQELVDELLSAARNAPITGVIPISVKVVGDTVLLDGALETPAIIDDAVARHPDYRYVSAYLIPSLELIAKFEDRVDSLGWWFEYFDQVNAWGQMDERAVLGDMLAAGVSFTPPPVEESAEDRLPGQLLPAASRERGELCWCPPGSFEMGPEGVPVTLTSGFWIGKHPVTQQQYELLMKENPSSFVGPDHPVDSIEKAEADAFCEALTQHEQAAGRLPRGWKFDLPTEAQWEYACRAGTTTAYSWGDDPQQAGDYAWYRENAGDRTGPVGEKRPNPWNLHDMHGNVLEICRDSFHERLPGGTDPEVTAADPSGEQFYVARGGGWFFGAEGLRSDDRGRLGPHDQSYLIGFRCALVPTGEPSDVPRHEPPPPVRRPSAPPAGYPDLNAGQLPFEEVQGLVDRAAWINTYVMPVPGSRTTPIRAPGGSATVVGFDTELSIHRFSIDFQMPAGATEVRASNRIGETAGSLHMKVLAMPHAFVARPDREPPPTPLTSDQPLRLAIQRATFSFGDGQDGFQSFGTGRTFPTHSGGQRLVATAIGMIQQGFGKFEGLHGVYVLSGELDPEQGFQGNIMIRVMDPRGVLQSSRPLPPLTPTHDLPESDAVYLAIRSRKSGPQQPTTYDLAEDGSVRGLIVPQTLYRAQADFAIDRSGRLVTHFDPGAAIGEEAAVVAVDPLRPDSQPGTEAAPSRFQGVGDYEFHDGKNTVVGGFTAQFLEGRTVNAELEGAPGLPANRFGFFGPLVEGFGCFAGAEGLLLGSTGAALGPHVLSNLYILRLNAPGGRFHGT